MANATKTLEQMLNTPLTERFPWPFVTDFHDFSNNVTALDPPVILDITPTYHKEIKLKRKLLDDRPQQTYLSYDHSLEAQWEILEMYMDEMESRYPEYFSVTKNGREWTFQNHLLQEEQTFIFGDESTLPYEPLEFISRHVQPDLIYLAQRDGDLFLDAGQLCFPAAWSLNFDFGMDFVSIHSPVPSRFTTSGLAEKIRKFIMNMEAGKPWTRFNWTITIEKIYDTSPEDYESWSYKRHLVTEDNAGELVNLRVEDQRLFRLPRSNGIIFSIQTHMILLEEICDKPEWARQFHNVLVTIADDIAEYKGFLDYKEKLINYFRKKLLATTNYELKEGGILE